MELYASQPRFHGGGTKNWAISSEVHDYLHKNVHEGMKTIETGAGYSTIVFSRKKCQHLCITPSESEVKTISEYCRDNGISLSLTKFFVGFSQNVLPGIEESDFDTALIDGGHGFPVPCIDYFFLAPRLKVGGILLIDDVDIWTGKMIVDVLRTEPEWEFSGKLARRTAVFKKVGEFTAREWCDQPTVVRKSLTPRLLRQLGNGIACLLQGDIAGLQDRWRRRFFPSQK